MNKDIEIFLNTQTLPDYKAYMKKKSIVRDVLYDGESIVENDIVSIESGHGGDVESERKRAIEAETMLLNLLNEESDRAISKEKEIDNKITNVATKEDIDNLFDDNIAS